MAAESYRDVIIPIGRRRLPGMLYIPSEASGLVIFAHGSGSSRLSGRNRFVARELQRAGIATLLFDLLDEQEAEDRRNVFDIELLAERLEFTAKWAREEPDAALLRFGYFGASTGAAAALIAAAQEPENVAAVVSRGGRPDLAQPCLARVAAPTLLIAGGYDETVIQLNELAFQRLRCEKDLVVIPRATHLFPEPGALEAVARHAVA